MNDELDPKLQELETKLRRLKPFCESFAPLAVKKEGFTAKNAKNSQRAQRQTAYVLATAVTILVVVCLLPRQQPQSISDDWIAAISETADILPSHSMRQQLAELLDEINVADAVAVAKPVYSVVEIVVQTSPPPSIKPMLGHPRWRWEEEMLAVF